MALYRGQCLFIKSSSGQNDSLHQAIPTYLSFLKLSILLSDTGVTTERIALESCLVLSRVLNDLFLP